MSSSGQRYLGWADIATSLLWTIFFLATAIQVGLDGAQGMPEDDVS